VTTAGASWSFRLKRIRSSPLSGGYAVDLVIDIVNAGPATMTPPPASLFFVAVPIAKAQHCGALPQRLAPRALGFCVVDTFGVFGAGTSREGDTSPGVGVGQAASLTLRVYSRVVLADADIRVLLLQRNEAVEVVPPRPSS
jgi:hypothetical protein